nr:adenylate/guanylate cyclase domain-containing protein [Chloroflexia bacterium]
MAPSLPSGHVTFLFTDIEGSTRLWERDAAAMRGALDRHNVILDEAIASHGGVHFKTIGDAFQAAFPTPERALAAAVAAQQELAREIWPETGPIRVRMGLHLGEAHPNASGDYLAPCLNRLARLLAVGYGGQ